MRRLVLALLVLLLAGCGEPALTAGQVIDREFEAAHYETYTVQDYAWVSRPRTRCTYDSYSKRNSCRTSYESDYVWVGSHQEQRWVKDHWFLTIRACPDDPEKKCRKRRVQVTQADYEGHNIGQWWEQA